MELRPYQVDISNAVMREWRTANSTLVVAPTGVGKTVILADIIRRMRPMKAMVVAHREELVWQARDKISRVTGLKCGVEMADVWVNQAEDFPVMLSTVQTQNSSWGDNKRMARFNPMNYGVLIIDECHHSTADTYKNIINYYTQNPDLRVLGVTATPDRADEEALGQIFQTVAYDYEILDAIHDGWLVPVHQLFASISGLDFSNVRTTAGDLNGADLSAVMEMEENLQGVAGAATDFIKGRRSIVFTASVKQAEVLCGIFNRHREGIADWVCGKTSKERRRYVLSQFEKGTVQVVCNCGVLTEGFDNPWVEAIVMARPTKSRSLYAQMCGRAMRPLPGLVDDHPLPEARRNAIASSLKPHMTILDFVGNSGRHKLITSAHILGGRVSEHAVDVVVGRAKDKATAVDVSKELEEEEERQRKKAEEQRKLEAARKAKLVAKVKYNLRPVNPFDTLDLMPVRDRAWDDGKSLTEKQKHILLTQGIDPDSMPFAQGRQILIEIFRRWDKKLCSIRQAAVLKRYGYESKEMPATQAKQLLDQLAKNHWKKI